MKLTRVRWVTWTGLAIFVIPLTACTAGQATRQTTNAPRGVPPTQSSSFAHADLAEVVGATYDTGTTTAIINTVTAHGSRTSAASPTPRTPLAGGYGQPPFESMIDLSEPMGVVNYATALYANQPVRWVEVRQSGGDAGHVPHLTQRISVPRDVASASSTPTPGGDNQSNNSGGDASFAGGSGLVPPGVSMDRGIGPLAQLGDSNAAKFDAILRVARSKLGAPYIWGHNEDRGQTGFDCSNFTAYVYHHALGYVISGASKVQFTSVGWSVPTYQIQPGDLLVFEQGKHVGIAVGNGQMIEAGGGRGQVAYMSIQPGSYWGNHLSAVKRMY